MSTTSTERPRQRGPSPPQRSISQRMIALDRANEVRLAQAALKRQTRSPAAAAAVLLDPHEHAGSMGVATLLMSMQRWGESRVSKVLALARISPVKRIGGLTARQRRELAALLEAGVAKQPVGGPGRRREREQGGRERRGRGAESDWGEAVEVLLGAAPGDGAGEAVGSGRAQR